ncbi:paraquat-inducible protein A [Stakelama saccharophila]|uniref:Paraquat-inducible protein A n=1 Tax=Stakelama saccharophila TaxID=3075605 RepID=A0ABZ0B8R8_9SPHN|nr:paraquat-inducible protein A [Stakelama sp. W311]WNO53811.1 paraquat-inducible protein A [Stakelama sp. W311]
MIRCIACDHTLERTSGRSATAALACSAATLLLLVPANLCTFLTTNAFGVFRHSVVASSAIAMLDDGWPLLAIVIFLFAVLFPVLRFAMLTTVLESLRRGREDRWLGPVFRYATMLETWAMPDVFLLGLAVAYFRLAAAISVDLGIGAYCYILAGILALFVRATLDKADIWERIADTHAFAPGTPLIGCIACEQIHPAPAEGTRCARCGKRLHARKFNSIGRTVALTLAAAILYFPANIYPLATLPIGFQPTRYTVLEGVIDLFHANLYGLALLVLTASFAIPILKLVGIGWCVSSVIRRSRKRLVAKTRVYRTVEEIGRWSMVDPFVIGCFTPVMHYNALIYGRAEAAAVPFTAVVILTIIGAKTFDPRLMWDAAGRAQ